VPSRWGVAGWYALGPRPGDPGSAVILGHVDSKRGPAVFYRLRQLLGGDEIDVSRAEPGSSTPRLGLQDGGAGATLGVSLTVLPA
jgi:sortase family protein